MGPAVKFDILLAEIQRFSSRDTEHPLHQVDAGDPFGDRMLYLQPGVHFQQVEVARRIDHEFHGAGRTVIYRFRQGNRGLTHLGTHFPGLRTATAPLR